MITPRFLDWLDVRQVDATRYRLLHEFRYDSSVMAARLIVPAGFITDFASVPRKLLVYYLVGGLGNGPATLHDFLYTIRRERREVCDAVFYEALITDGADVGQPAIEGWRARLMFAGVRVGGEARWARE